MSVGVLVGPLLNLSGRQSRGRQAAGVISDRGLADGDAHPVGQLRDAGDEPRMELVAVVVPRDLRISHFARGATKALDRRGVDPRRGDNGDIAGLVD
jgi:hypothetical protein